MACQACGNPVQAGTHFCPRCGAQIAAAAAPPPPSPYPPNYSPNYAPGYAPGHAPGYPPMVVMPEHRVQRNLQTLGVLWCIFGAYRILAGLIGIFVLRIATFRSFSGAPWIWGDGLHGAFGPPWMAALLPLIAVVSIAAALLAFVVAFGLLTRQSWGRVVAIILAILSLLKFPFGTALGIYTLWVLMPSESGMEYDTLANR